MLAVALAAALGAPLLGAAPAVADPTPTGPAQRLAAKADAKVQRQLATQDQATFWVQLDSEADTTEAEQATTKAARGRAVIKAKTAYADKSQAGLKALLKKADASYRSFWISNTVMVTGDRALARKIAARDDVAAIQSDDPIEMPDPIASVQEATVNGFDWNIDAINAPKVWSEFGDRGEGVVIGSIDTGVDWNHPALLSSYRGLKADGGVDHSHNWFDPTGFCAERTTGPCDDVGHGTHTMGTMVGDDGQGNQIGVAPGATWIAAKACTTTDCTRSALLAAGQWMLAPTDSDGADPRPDLAPDVINNSWGAAVLDPWYSSMVQAWRDAGIFPAFSNGNTGPGCDTAGSPGAYANTYASGAFGVTGRIADFSSRGTGENGVVKPNIAAPGVNIRSAAPGGGYVPKSGTSMASPHTAATVALVWSAAPSLRGDIAATEAVLDQSAVDVDATGCGGTAADNNVYGEGRLDAYAAVSAAPRGALGKLTGTVTAASGDPVADAEVRLNGKVKVMARTDKNGTYTLPRVTAGDYKVAVTRFGFLDGETTATVTENTTTTADLTLTKAPTGTLTGRITSASGPEADVDIVLPGTPARTTTAADGTYALTLPTGDYQVNLTPRNKCAESSALALTMTTSDRTENIALADRTDASGTTCRQVDEAFPTGDTKVGITGPYGGYSTQDLPFPVALYGRTYDKASISLDGSLIFGYLTLTAANTRLPTTATPNGALYPFWDDLRMDADSGIYTAVRGTAPHRTYVVEWRDMQISKTPERRLSFAAEISEDGTYTFHYKGLDAGGVDDELGAGATVGAENHTGTDAFLYAFKQRSLREGMAIRFRPERHAVVNGSVTDANDGKPITGSSVTVTRDGTQIAKITPRADGAYLGQIPVPDPGEYQVTISAPHYETVTRTATLDGLGVLHTDAALKTGVVTTDHTDGWTVVIPQGQTRTRTLTLTDTGSAADYTVKEKTGLAWVTAAPAAGRLGAGARQQVTLTFDTSKATAGTVLRGTVVVASESGRAPTTEIPVTVVVPAYRTAVDVGSSDATPYVDHLGDTWTADRPWTSGSYGFVGDATTVPTTPKTITGTDDQKPLRTARQSATEYRFDQLPSGVYQVELSFAELSGVKPGHRVFDVTAEGAQKVSNVDIALETGGSYRALTKTFTVKVTDGQLNLGLSSVTGETLLNTVRVTHRPDLTA
ncbi:S8 family serine peptidase [Streptomyces sp. Q6]|uniref:S8 family serine peptidase n=1 Tax=Streptomyces citrinus TaxID=3118173 RepID=A0ACD5A9H0_9ACTN